MSEAQAADEQEQQRRVQAAMRIQKAWRSHHHQYLNAEARWNDAAKAAKLKIGREAANLGHNAPRDRWKRAIHFAARLQDDNRMLRDSGIDVDSETDAGNKILETQHWLELVDGYFRSLVTSEVGALTCCQESIDMVLIWYHRRWQTEPTTENFFKWLDEGEGKSLSLSECPRSQLEKERIVYLSAEQRLNYLVKIDQEGKLRWAKTGTLVDTAAGHWKDRGDGKGIVPDDTSHRPKQPEHRRSFESIAPSLSSEESVAATHYAGGPVKGKYAWTRALRRYFTTRGIVDRLLRKTIRANTWIYVTDKNFNMFIGIKDTGNFQHSSFLAGGLVTSAGLISVKEGIIHTLSPLSGHYRTSIDHFHTFIDAMYQRGADMRRVQISKAELALFAIEHINKWKKKKSRVVQRGKEDLKEVTEKLADVLHPNVEANGNWKRQILEGRKERKGEKERPKDQQETSQPRPLDS